MDIIPIVSSFHYVPTDILEYILLFVFHGMDLSIECTTEMIRCYYICKLWNRCTYRLIDRFHPKLRGVSKSILFRCFATKNYVLFPNPMELVTLHEDISDIFEKKASIFMTPQGITFMDYYENDVGIISAHISGLDYFRWEKNPVYIEPKLFPLIKEHPYMVVRNGDEPELVSINSGTIRIGDYSNPFSFEKLQNEEDLDTEQEDLTKGVISYRFNTDEIFLLVAFLSHLEGKHKEQKTVMNTEDGDSDGDSDICFVLTSRGVLVLDDFTDMYIKVGDLPNYSHASVFTWSFKNLSKFTRFISKQKDITSFILYPVIIHLNYQNVRIFYMEGFAYGPSSNSFGYIDEFDFTPYCH